MKRDNLVLGFTIFILVITLPLVLLVTQGRIDLRPRAEFGDANLSFSPVSLGVAVGEEKLISIVIDTGDKLLSGIDVSLIYDADVIEVVDITATDYFDTPLLVETNIATNTEPYSAVKLVLVRKTGTSQLESGELALASIKIRGKQSGSSPLVMRPGEIVAYNPDGDDSLLSALGDLETLIDVDNGSPTGNEPVISFRTKLAYASSERNLPDVTTVLTVIDSLQDNPTQKQFEIVLQADKDQIYRPLRLTKELVGVAPGNSKTILVKGPKHLRKKVAEQIALKPGGNPDFDWTAVSKQLPPGDLPDPDLDYRQDGVINARDIYLLKARIGSRKAGDTAIADLNYDGAVLANDLDILFRTISTQYDDE